MKLRKEYIAEFVYGAIDGTVTTFAVMAGALGASLSPVVVLILGFANLFADGFSMAASNYLSRKSDESIGFKIPLFKRKTPINTAWVTFISFIGVGIIPLLPFVFVFVYPETLDDAFTYSIGMTVVAFALIGYIRGWVTDQNRIRTTIETLLIGGAAALIAFAVGYFLKSIVG